MNLVSLKCLISSATHWTETTQVGIDEKHYFLNKILCLCSWLLQLQASTLEIFLERPGLTSSMPASFVLGTANLYYLRHKSVLDRSFPWTACRTFLLKSTGRHQLWNAIFFLDWITNVIAPPTSINVNCGLCLKMQQANNISSQQNIVLQGGKVLWGANSCFSNHLYWWYNLLLW